MLFFHAQNQRKGVLIIAEVSFNYYHGKESEQFSFFRIPKVLYTDPIFKNLSSDAKVLYGILLDRMELSMKNGWVDLCLPKHLVAKGKNDTEWIIQIRFYEFQQNGVIHKVIIECKNHQRKIEKGMIQSFKGVLDDVGNANAC